MAFNNTVVARAAAAIWGLQLGYVTTQAVLAQANANGGSLDAIINAAFNDSYGSLSDSVVAAAFVNNLGLTGEAATAGTDYVISQLAAAAPGTRGSTLASIASLFSGLGGDPAFGPAANDFNARVAAAVVYSSTPGTQDSALGPVPSATSFRLTMGQDNLTGSAGNDTFTAYIIAGSATLQDADFIDGGAGFDTLYADMAGASFAVTPITTSVEAIKVRAQSNAAGDGGQNNPGTNVQVRVDAERITGATHFESNNSRTDLIIEDVRILPSQITKDITVAFVQSDPGNVDFGLYFDQYSLTANRSSSSTLTLDVMDIRAAAGAATAATPLLNSPYDGVSFTLNGELVLLQDQTINDATTYAQLLAAIQADLIREGYGGTITAALGGSFTVLDSETGQTVTGTSIVLTALGGTFGIGNWIASEGVPANSNLWTNQTTVASSSVDLVTSTVILDDVGRGSNGGDLVIGGMSTGVTSASRGVDRFEITVERDSRLQNIDSTNNWLKEVTFKNGATNGLVSVIGNQGSTNDTTQLPGATSNHDNYGFNDVRLIDASAMVGNVTFDALVSQASFNKYVNIIDTQVPPEGDNGSTPGLTTRQVADFIYSGGTGNDSITVDIEGVVVGSHSTVFAGREDFTFRINGNAGDDRVLLRIVDDVNQGGVENWYYSHHLLRNVTIDTGTGNDTVRKPGPGDVIISTGEGADTIYTENSGGQVGLVIATNGTSTAYTNWNPYATSTTASNAIWTFNTYNTAVDPVVSATAARYISDLRTDTNETYRLYRASVTVDFLGLTKTVTLPGSVFNVTDLYINQRIKDAINNDPVLSKLLVAVDGPGFTLMVKSLIDGVYTDTSLNISVTRVTGGSLTESERTAVAAAYGLADNAIGTVETALAAALDSFVTNADYGVLDADGYVNGNTSVGFDANFGRDSGGVNAIVGADSTATSDNTITPGAGNDVIVLGTDSAGVVGLSASDFLDASNDVVVFSGIFGSDTIVNFDVAGAGIDRMNVSALGGVSNGATFSNLAGVAGVGAANQTHRSITIDDLVVGAGGNDTAARVAAYFTEGGNTTLVTHVVVVVDTATNIGNVWSVSDAIGGTVGSPNITATLSGTIDLANTDWATVVAANFT